MGILSGAQLAGGNSATVKADNDFYATDPITVDIFMKKAKHDKIFESLDGKLIWECACGNGNISRKLTEYFPLSKVKSTDLIYRGYGQGDVNFLSSDFQEAEMIITNPPFSLINEFICKALELTQRYVVFFAKIQVLETVSRKELLEKSPLKYIYVHSTRQATWKDGKSRTLDGKKWATTMFLAWFVWDKEYKGEPTVRFL